MLDNATQSALEQIKKEGLNNSLFSTIGTENYFASVIDTNTGYVATAVDGVGSKIEHLIEHEMYDVIGKDCFAMCYNDLLCVGANPVSFSDHITSTSTQAFIIPEVIHGIAEYCRDTFTLLSGGETEILDKTNFHISGSMTGIISDPSLIKDGTKVEEGDLIVGLESSGIHSNGWTFINKRLPQLIEPTNLKPTIIYKEIHAIHARTNDIPAIVNITGGGFRNLERIPQNLQYDIQHEPKQRLFQVIQTVCSHRDWDRVDPTKELYSTLNMGVGMIVIVKPKDLDIVLEVYDNKSQVLGIVSKSDRPRVVVNGQDISGNTKPYKSNKEVQQSELNYSLTDN